MAWLKAMNEWQQEDVKVRPLKEALKKAKEEARLTTEEINTNAELQKVFDKFKVGSKVLVVAAT